MQPVPATLVHFMTLQRLAGSVIINTWQLFVYLHGRGRRTFVEKYTKYAERTYRYLLLRRVGVLIIAIPVYTSICDGSPTMMRTPLNLTTKN